MPRYERLPPSGAEPPLDLHFELLDQIHEDWCWAAVSASIINHYLRNNTQPLLPGRIAKTCAMVNCYRAGPAEQCCQTTPPAACLGRQVLSYVLYDLDHLDHMIDPASNADWRVEVRGALRNNHPVVVGIREHAWVLDKVELLPGAARYHLMNPENPTAINWRSDEELRGEWETMYFLKPSGGYPQYVLDRLRAADVG